MVESSRLLGTDNVHWVPCSLMASLLTSLFGHPPLGAAKEYLADGTEENTVLGETVLGPTPAHRGKNRESMKIPP